MRRLIIASVSLALFFTASAFAQDNALAKQASQALHKAVDYFRTKVSVQGSYLWRYSEDLKLREGEGIASATQAWVQPPGTPSVGLAYLKAYENTGDRYYLEAARETGMALVLGQLQSGGWDYKIEFHPGTRKKHAYRADGPSKIKSMTTLDDNNTQEAVRFLMRLDKTLAFKDKGIHEATGYALTCLLKAQYPNGAWPQRYSDFPDPARYPVKKAAYPDAYPWSWPNVDYRDYYTLNDNTLADMIDVMLEAAEIYQNAKYRAAALKAGDFIILAQMPEPQPGWAQQYDVDMHPAWARKFEPASITGGESQGAMLTLLRLYRDTSEKKYLEPIPKALAYYRKVQLSNGQMARFYELHTNKPLYFTKTYVVTYSDADMPTHYGFKTGNRLDRIATEYESLLKKGPSTKAAAKQPATPGDALTASVKRAIAALDEQGRWYEAGKMKNFGADDPTRRVLNTRTFISNVNTLSSYLSHFKKQ